MVARHIPVLTIHDQHQIGFMEIGGEMDMVESVRSVTIDECDSGQSRAPQLAARDRR